MSVKRHSEVRQETIDQLKLLGFTHLQLVLLDHEISHQATVEIIPRKDHGAGLDTVSLWSGDTDVFGDWQSKMARYVIDRAFLKIEN